MEEENWLTKMVDEIVTVIIRGFSFFMHQVNRTSRGVGESMYQHS